MFQMDWILKKKKLNGLLKKRFDFEKKKPFPYVIIDNFLPKKSAKEIFDNFPILGKTYLDRSQKYQKTKHLSRDIHLMPEIIRELLMELNSGLFIDFLEKITNIEGLIPDPHYIGAGIHQLHNGGFLKIHRDFLRHKKNHTTRVLNLLIYFNKNWKKKYRGNLEFYSDPNSKPKVKIEPIFNRVVIFQTNLNSWHGYPEPLNLPENYYRNALVCYYYVLEKNLKEKKKYKTLWK